MKLTNISFTICVLTALALLSLFGIQSVAAQIAATSSENVTTSTEVTMDTIQASTTSSTDSATTITQDTSATTTTFTESVAPENPPTSVPAFEPTTSARDTVALEISSLEDAYMQKTGRYLQVIAGNQLPMYESGSVAGKLGQNIPDYASVDVYEAVNGKGYQIYFEQNGTLYSYGYGSEASARTYTIRLPVPTATSTSP